MKLGTLLALIVSLFAVSSAHASSGKVFGNYNKGYAVDSRESRSGFTFLDEKRKPVLTLSAKEHQLWKASKLSSCRLSEPVWQVKDKGGALLTIHIFGNGIIYEEGGEYTSMNLPQAEKWWDQLGLTRVRKK
jgi:hypothetical protein